MAANSTLIAVKNRGPLNGFENIFKKENRQWWLTWQWVIQVVIWLAIVNGMMAMVTLAAPKIEEAQARQEINSVEAATAREALKQTSLVVFFLFIGLAPAVGVVIIAQDALITGRQTGITAWILSKPISRSAYLLSKMLADALGVLGTMILAPGICGYLIYWAGLGVSLPLPGYLAGLGLAALLLLFYLSLTYMLGTMFQQRGPVLGFPMILIFGNQLAGLLPWLGKVLPWNLVMDLGPEQPALAVRLAQGLPLPSIAPIVGTAGLTIVFIAVAIWRFEHEAC